MVPLVGAWDADDRLRLWYRRDPGDTGVCEAARAGMLSDTKVCHLSCQLLDSRSAKPLCVVPIRGSGVAVQDWADRPAENPVINSPSRSGPVN